MRLRTYPDDSTLSDALLEQLTTRALDALPDLFRVLLNAAMQIERQKAPRGQPARAHRGAHSPRQRLQGQAAVHPPRPNTLAVPQMHAVDGQQGGFYPQALERGTRSERALKLWLTEIYVQGTSTRRVAAITGQLPSPDNSMKQFCGFAVGNGQVSQAAKELDATLEACVRARCLPCSRTW